MRQHDTEDWDLAETAALWVLRLKGPGAERYLRAFERWCARSDQHQIEFFLASMIEFQFDALKRTQPPAPGRRLTASRHRL